MIAVKDLDNLAARLHGRRARMAEGTRLYELCGLGSPEALAAALFPGAGISSSPGIQRRLEEDLFIEIRGLASSVGKAQGSFLHWLAARLQAENLKVAVRRISAGAPAEEARGLIAGPPAAMEPYGPGLLKAKTRAELLAALPAGPLRDGLARGYGLYSGGSSLFLQEAAVDSGYLTELLARAAALPAPGRDAAADLAAQEADIFHLALVSRGRFFHGLEIKDLLGLHVPGSLISPRRFSRMLSAPDLEAARELAAGPVIDRSGPGAAAAGLERLGWRRYARLANNAFRGSNVDFGVVAGYAALRRLEAASLTTVAEGLRLGVPAHELRGLATRIRGRGVEGV